MKRLAEWPSRVIWWADTLKGVSMDENDLQLDNIRTRNERRKGLVARLADGKHWYAHNPDDDVYMNMMLVTANPIEPDYDDVVKSRDDNRYEGDVIAVTLLQSPRILFAPVDALALAYLIADEHNQPASADIDTLLQRIEKRRASALDMNVLLTRMSLTFGLTALVVSFGFWIGMPFWLAFAMALIVQALVWELLNPWM